MLTSSSVQPEESSHINQLNSYLFKDKQVKEKSHLFKDKGKRKREESPVHSELSESTSSTCCVRVGWAPG